MKRLDENVAANIETSSSVKSTSWGKASKVELTSNHKSGLSRQEAFSIKPPKNKFQDTGPAKSEKDFKPDKLNERVKTDASPENQKGACLHSHSSCTLKCGKNKSVCEKKTTQSKNKKECINKRRPQSLKIPRRIECSGNEPSQSSRVNSHQNLAENSPPTVNSRDVASAESVSQSLDLSLNLLLQNFCLSPPRDAPEFRLSIDISSDKNNSGLKVNISQTETQVENELKNSIGSKKNEESDSKPRKRLSSNSDSRIPRLKKIPNPNRPSSFHGSLATSKRRDHKVELSDKILGRHSTKIPTLQLEGMSPSIPKERQDEEQQSPSDSCFQTPDATFFQDTSSTWIDGSHYLSALASPDDSMTNKRESIVKILKYNPGHVLSKVSMFDSKGSSGSESDCKLMRTSSEKYSSASHRPRPKLTVSNSYNAVGRSDSIRYGTTPRKQERAIPRRVSFKARDSPLSKKSLPKCTEENTVPEEIIGDSSNVELPKLGNKK